ncbi:MAG: anti-sigma factor [Thermodesulfobacteriota bacterium]
MNTCKYFCDQLSDYLDGEMSQNECTLIEEHLSVCPPCALFFKALQMSVRACSQGVDCRIPDEVRTRLKKFLKEHCAEHQS